MFETFLHDFNHFLVLNALLEKTFFWYFRALKSEPKSLRIHRVKSLNSIILEKLSERVSRQITFRNVQVLRNVIVPPGPIPLNPAPGFRPLGSRCAVGSTRTGSAAGTLENPEDLKKTRFHFSSSAANFR